MDKAIEAAARMTLGGNDKKVVHAMVRRLMKRGVWEHQAQKPGRLDSITCGPVKIERWKASRNVSVYVNGFHLCDSNADYAWGRLAVQAKAFFYGHYDKYLNEHLTLEFAKARAALSALKTEVKP